ncbi:DUF1330 domain-containing protein [uncultured Jannaschia sp.]|uniref:DUF1330 domain-containing protein n=1 Tax=uncultured Jannaschia sp. TaxID=293347 RepID=UPI00261DA2BD|nr:DUF1330 domain-containing protein [uncultured Jannaschia sp.]
MTAYSVLEVTPKTEDWIEDYLPTANKVIARHGGRYLARTQTHEVLEGENREVGLRIVIEWPSMDAAHAFESDPEYAPHLKARLANSRSHHALIAGMDDLA